jgi:hypothetical protein
MSAFAPSGGEPLWRVSRHPRSLRLKTNPAETSKISGGSRELPSAMYLPCALRFRLGPRDRTAKR